MLNKVYKQIIPMIYVVIENGKPKSYKWYLRVLRSSIILLLFTFHFIHNKFCAGDFSEKDRLMSLKLSVMMHRYLKLVSPGKFFKIYFRSLTILKSQFFGSGFSKTSKKGEPKFSDFIHLMHLGQENVRCHFRLSPEGNLKEMNFSTFSF